MNPGVPEKRRFARLSFKVLVKWKKIMSNPGIPPNNLDTVRDISRGGVYITVSQKIELGDILSLQIKLSPKVNILAKGRVAWVEEPNGLNFNKGYQLNAGIEFLDMNEEDKKELADFILNSFMNR